MTKLKPDGYAAVIPFLFVRDVEASLSFYEGVLGFARANVNEQDGRIVHAELRYRDRIVALVGPEGTYGDDSVSPASRGQTSSVEILVYVEDADVCYEAASQAGGVCVGDPKNQPWGERLGQMWDPDGYRWLLAQNLAGGEE